MEIAEFELRPEAKLLISNNTFVTWENNSTFSKLSMTYNQFFSGHKMEARM